MKKKDILGVIKALGFDEKELEKILDSTNRPCVQPQEKNNKSS